MIRYPSVYHAIGHKKFGHLRDMDSQTSMDTMHKLEDNVTQVQFEFVTREYMKRV